MNKLRSSALIFAIAAIISFSGCSSESSDNTAVTEQAGEESAETTAASEQQEFTADNFSERISAAQLEAGSTQMDQDMTTSGEAVTMSSQVVMADTFEEVKMNMTMEAAGVTTEMIMVDGYAYMGMGDLTQGMYIKMSLEEMAAADPTFDESTLLPTANMDAYSEAIESLTAEPGETIDGVETTKLTLVMNTQELMEATGESGTAASETLGESVTYDMYVGEDDLPRRFIMDLGDTETTVNFTNWGEDFDITAPPADQVMDA